MCVCVSVEVFLFVEQEKGNNVKVTNHVSNGFEQRERAKKRENVFHDILFY